MLSPALMPAAVTSSVPVAASYVADVIDGATRGLATVMSSMLISKPSGLTMRTPKMPLKLAAAPRLSKPSSLMIRPVTDWPPPVGWKLASSAYTVNTTLPSKLPTALPVPILMLVRSNTPLLARRST
ncbi:hypothetical protein DUPY_43920 [Duganella phyllosphaerae]|uniref:Uncharacterized protein n=1 Tax=Duganella phyllosphaerae TaxID=762836 RepID=A0A1E7WCN1_9BURK|nr:hypothetical protein DUPY_43920 [Duganella phyllosphaerae]